MSFRHLIISTVSLVALCVLTACSVPVNYYLRNPQNYPVKVTISTYERLGDTTHYRVLEGKITGNITYNAYQEMPTEATQYLLDGKEYTFSARPGYTYFLQAGSNFAMRGVRRIMVGERDGPTELLDERNSLFKQRVYGKRYVMSYEIR
ncbi:hypothetical protein [Neolewinella antarctica]|uniref:Lipoprotein n=1 Tax=Neolewinella antarctica TaxID=442734 RepID=A0ABX0X6A9_9BACT|nr:hypothetical protein [Neolewinella antarctica]NJC24531.1 hypothetical protein [Neolewinella antarctica]